MVGDRDEQQRVGGCRPVVRPLGRADDGLRRQRLAGQRPVPGADERGNDEQGDAAGKRQPGSSEARQPAARGRPGQ
jgi:hypothetical protein